MIVSPRGDTLDDMISDYATSLTFPVAWLSNERGKVAHAFVGRESLSQCSRFRRGGTEWIDRGRPRCGKCETLLGKLGRRSSFPPAAMADPGDDAA